MKNDLDTFAARLSAAWSADDPPGACPVEQWLRRFLTTVPVSEPDTCADGWSRLGRDQWRIRWYDDGERVLGFLDDGPGYVIPWREIEAFLRRFDACEDDEPLCSRQLPLAG